MTVHRRSTAARVPAARVPTLLAVVATLLAVPALAACGGPSAGSAKSGDATGGSATSTAPANAPSAGAPGTNGSGTGDSAASGSGTNGGGPATVDATFSGAVSGHFDNPVKGPKYACGTPTFPDLFSLNDVEGTVGGSAYALQISINNFTGSGKQTGNVVITVTAGTDTSHAYLTLSRPPTVVMSGKQSGTFEGDAQQGLDSAAPTVHITGTFHC